MATTATLDRLRHDRDQAREAAIALVEADDFDPENSQALTDLEERATSLDNQIARLAALQQQRDAADALDGRIARASQETRERTSPVAAGLSWGEAFVRSDQFAEYRGRGSSGRYELDGGRWQERALPTGISDLIAAGLTGATTTVDTTPAPAPTPLLDNVNQVQVNGNAIEFVSWAKTAGGAAVVAEKANKPSAEWAPTVTSTTLDTIAVWTQLTRQMIEDFAAVRDYIDGELRRDVAREEEAQALAALNAADALIPEVAGDDLLAGIRVGIGTVQAEGYTPTAVLLNPSDWAALDNDVMGATLNGPVIRQQFWGLQVIPSVDQPEGSALVGDFRSAMTRFYRSAIALYVSDSHASTFIANVFTLLAERRSKTAVVRPQALVECTGPVTP